MYNTELIKRLKKFTESYKYDLDLTDEEAEQIIQALEGDEMYLNMQYYMEYCKSNGYVTPQEWIEKHKHFKIKES